MRGIAMEDVRTISSKDHNIAKSLAFERQEKQKLKHKALEEIARINDEIENVMARASRGKKEIKRIRGLIRRINTSLAELTNKKIAEKMNLKVSQVNYIVAKKTSRQRKHISD
jgi:hypothetical protein